jgi:oligopeptide transport system substrate-binding protein
VDGFTDGVGVPYSPTLAQQWLAAAGYPNGQGLPPITPMYDPRFTENLTIASHFRQNWMDNLDVTVALSVTSWSDYLSLLGTDPPQVWQLRWIADHYDAYNFLYDSINSLGRVKYGNWSNNTYDGLLNLAARTADLNTRKSLYKQAEEILVETDAVMSPVYYYANGTVAKPHLQRTYGSGGWGGRIADWRIMWRVFLPVILKN